MATAMDVKDDVDNMKDNAKTAKDLKKETKGKGKCRPNSKSSAPPLSARRFLLSSPPTPPSTAPAPPPYRPPHLRLYITRSQVPEARQEWIPVGGEVRAQHQRQDQGRHDDQRP